MSWSLTYIGNPDKIVAALEANSAKLEGKSKEEYDEALPHLVALVKQNHNKAHEPALKLTANGHAYDGHSQCAVNLENLGGTLV